MSGSRQSWSSWYNNFPSPDPSCYTLNAFTVPYSTTYTSNESIIQTVIYLTAAAWGDACLSAKCYPWSYGSDELAYDIWTPATRCPSGWVPVTTQTALDSPGVRFYADEFEIQCCPDRYRLSVFAASSRCVPAGSSSTHFTVLSFCGDSQARVPATLWSNIVPDEHKSPEIFAYPLRLRFRLDNLDSPVLPNSNPASAIASSTPTTTLPDTANIPKTSTPTTSAPSQTLSAPRVSKEPAASALSTGVKIVMGISIPLVSLPLCAVAMVLCWRRRRRRYGNGNPRVKSQQQGFAKPELDAAETQALPELYELDITDQALHTVNDGGNARENSGVDSQRDDAPTPASAPSLPVDMVAPASPQHLVPDSQLHHFGVLFPSEHILSRALSANADTECQMLTYSSLATSPPLGTGEEDITSPDVHENSNQRLDLLPTLPTLSPLPTRDSSRTKTTAEQTPQTTCSR